MLRELIQNLRRKPKVVRDNIALGAAGTLTAAVLVGWLVIDGPNTVNIEGVVTEGEEGAGAFSTLFGEIKDQAAALGDIFPKALENEIQAEEPLVAPESTPLPLATATSSSAASTTDTAKVIRIATTSPESEN